MCSCPPPPPFIKTKRNSGKGLNDVLVPFFSNCYLPLFYLRKTKHWSLLHFKGFFSVNSFCCYCFCVLYFLLFVYFYIFFPWISLFFFLCCSYFGVDESETEGNIRSGLISWLFGTETANQMSRILRLVSPLDFHVAAMSQHPHWHQVQKLCVEASVNTFRCGNTNSLVRKMYI